MNLNADEVPFDIVDDDVTGIVVRTRKGATVSGVMVLEGTDDKTALEMFRRGILTAMVAVGNSDRPSTGWTQIAADGNFTLSGLATGTVYFNLSSSPRFRITRIERNGVVQPRGLDIREGESITGLRLVVSYGNATIRGVVEPASGTLPPGARFFVYLRSVSEEPSIYTSSSSMSADVDARGQFLVEGLQPGTYEINAGLVVRDARTQVSGNKTQQIEVTAGSNNNVKISVELTPVTLRP